MSDEVTESILNSSFPKGKVLFTINEAGVIFSVSRPTIARMMRIGALRTVKIAGRRMIHRADIERVLREGLEVA